MWGKAQSAARQGITAESCNLYRFWIPPPPAAALSPPRLQHILVPREKRGDIFLGAHDSIPCCLLLLPCCAKIWSFLGLFLGLFSSVVVVLLVVQFLESHGWWWCGQFLIQAQIETGGREIPGCRRSSWSHFGWWWWWWWWQFLICSLGRIRLMWWVLFFFFSLELSSPIRHFDEELPL